MFAITPDALAGRHVAGTSWLSWDVVVVLIILVAVALSFLLFGPAKKWFSLKKSDKQSGWTGGV